jgi:hypothetical protein
MKPLTVAVSARFRSYARTHALGYPAQSGIRGIPRNQPPGAATTAHRHTVPSPSRPQSILPRNRYA